MAGTKYDGGKPRMDLLDPDAIEGLAKVLTFGADKYAAHNWRGGIAYSRITASLLRHLMAFQRGEDIDPESGLPHIDHIGCNWMFLSYFTKHRTDLDDRFGLCNAAVVAEQDGDPDYAHVEWSPPVMDPWLPLNITNLQHDE